ncbi:MAG: hypothetical protein IJ355_05315, partial [Prevotella sp.]|nr:hypothetical protein [Prevotella sp.]
TASLSRELTCTEDLCVWVVLPLVMWHGGGRDGSRPYDGMKGAAHDVSLAFAAFRMRGGALFAPLRLCV